MSRILFSALALVTLTSCATLLEGSSQAVTFDAKGANNVECTLKTGELSYRVRPPETIWMKRSRLDMVADCWAPGNRHKIFKIPTTIEPWTATNVSNGIVPGVTYDTYSRAFFKYPERVLIDMSDTVATPSELPTYHDPNGIDPKTVGIEYMGPENPALPDDAYNNAKRAAAFEEYDREQAFEAEREERKAIYDAGVK